jgi:hypothetical protein
MVRSKGNIVVKDKAAHSELSLKSQQEEEIKGYLPGSASK